MEQVPFIAKIIFISHRIADALAELIVPIEIGPQAGYLILSIEETSSCEKVKGWSC